MSIKPIAPLSKEKPEVSAPVETAPIAEINTSANPLSTEALLTLIASMQQQLVASQKAAAESNAALANAILETTKPREYIKTAKELAAEANQKLFEQTEKELARRQKATKAYEQKLCDHIAGGKGEIRDVHQRTCILWHRTDAQVDIGICMECGRLFHPEDPLDDQNHDYTYWRRKGSINKASSAGVRQFMNPLQAQHDSFLRDS